MRTTTALSDSYYDDIPCPFRPETCTIKHTKLNREKWKAMQGDPITVGQRLLRSAVEPVYYLYLAPYGCFGDRQVTSDDGEVIVTTDPHKHYGKDSPVVYVDMKFLNRTPHVLVDELL